VSALLGCGGDGHGNGPTTPTPSPSGTPPIQPTPTATPDPTFTIAEDLPSASGVAAAFGGERYLVTFSQPTDRAYDDVVGVRLTTDGSVLDSAPLLLSDLGAEPFLGPVGAYVPGGIAFASGSFGAFFFGSSVNDAAGPPGQVVGFVGVPPDGPPVLPATAIDEQLSFSMAQTALVSPVAATSNGALFLGVYQRVLSLAGAFLVSRVTGQIVTGPPDVRAQEIGPFSGIAPPPDGIITSGSPPGVATRDDGAALVAWIETVVDQDRPSDPTTRLQGVVLTESAATPVTLAGANANSYGVAIATEGTSFLIVWSTATDADPNTRSELRAIRYTPGGAPEPAGGFVVAGGAAAKDIAGIVFASGEFLVAWTENGALRAARLGTTGTAVTQLTLEPGPVAAATLATDGARVLVVFEREESNDRFDILGRFVTLE
jgi:hypothetical protein